MTLTYSVLDAQAVVRSTLVLHPTRAGGKHSTEDNLSGCVQEAKWEKKKSQFDHALSSASKSLYSISSGRRGSSDNVWNRWLLFFFKESFLCNVVTLSQSKGLSQWRGATTGFSLLSWLHTPLKPAWASAVTNASAGKHQGDKSSQEVIAWIRHRWESDSCNIERNWSSNTKTKPGVSLRKLCRRKICFKQPETPAKRTAQQILVSEILQVSAP